MFKPKILMSIKFMKSNISKCSGLVKVMTKFEKILKMVIIIFVFIRGTEQEVLKCVWVTQSFKNCPEN